MQPTDKTHAGAVVAKMKAEAWFADYATSMTVKLRKIHCLWIIQVEITGLKKPLDYFPPKFDEFSCHVKVDGHVRR